MTRFILSIPLLSSLCLLAIPSLALANELPTAEKINRVIRTAKTYIGTPHRLGGMNKKGIDCSGLMVVSFRTVGHQLPRVSRDQAKVGKSVSRTRLQAGDLVFFRHAGKINHVGLVTTTQGSKVHFIHASSSRGVMVSSLSDSYWQSRYSQARRVWGDLPRIQTPLPPKPPVVQLPRRPRKRKQIERVQTLDFQQVQQRKLRYSDIESLSRKERKYLEAEILARHGYIFPQARLRRYFQAQTWYQQLGNKTRKKSVAKKRMTKIEKRNWRWLKQQR